MKKGQIAHLDRNSDNNDPQNLVFLCLDHHDEYDSKTSQSKGLQKAEVEAYREELHHHFSSWSVRLQRDQLLNFLAFHTADLDAMAGAAIKAGHTVVFYGESHAFDVLVTDAVDYCDADLFLPHLAVLELFESWGWLTYSQEEMEMESDMPRVFIQVQRNAVCDQVANRILELSKERVDAHAALLSIARARDWKPR